VELKPRFSEVYYMSLPENDGTGVYGVAAAGSVSTYGVRGYDYCIHSHTAIAGLRIQH
jgi:hypothetical protein